MSRSWRRVCRWLCMAARVQRKPVTLMSSACCECKQLASLRPCLLSLLHQAWGSNLHVSAYQSAEHTHDCHASIYITHKYTQNNEILYTVMRINATSLEKFTFILKNMVKCHLQQISVCTSKCSTDRNDRQELLDWCRYVIAIFPLCQLLITVPYLVEFVQTILKCQPLQNKYLTCKSLAQFYYGRPM